MNNMTQKDRTMVKILAIVSALFLALCWMSSAKANGVDSAQLGKVVDVQFARATTSQQTQYREDSGYQANHQSVTQTYCTGPISCGESSGQPQGSHTSAAVGGVLGGVIGTVAMRNSHNDRWLGSSAGAALGAVIGNVVDRNSQSRRQREYQAQQRAQQESQRRDEAFAQANARREATGAQVIVQMEDGRNVAVFVHDGARFQRGQKVWMIGSSQIIPRVGRDSYKNRQFGS